MKGELVSSWPQFFKSPDKSAFEINLQRQKVNATNKSCKIYKLGNGECNRNENSSRVFDEFVTFLTKSVHPSKDLSAYRRGDTLFGSLGVRDAMACVV
eukprot:4636144-Amphidinium_carterae.1